MRSARAVRAEMFAMHFALCTTLMCMIMSIQGVCARVCRLALRGVLAKNAIVYGGVATKHNLIWMRTDDAL